MKRRFKKRVPDTTELPLSDRLEVELRRVKAGKLAAMRRKRAAKSLAGVLSGAVAVLLLFQFVIGVARVQGHSMFPSLEEGEYILYLRIPAAWQRGDVVVLRNHEREEYVKRIAALPGETVEIGPETGTVSVDGRPLPDRFQLEKTIIHDVAYPLTLDQDSYFVLGDNRAVSLDSRDSRLGPVKRGQIRGRVIGTLRIFARRGDGLR